ncbi:arginine exporter protein ArgO [Nocardiopsis sp. Huas11]|uniref:LysE family transporter n=1 Tax=Nocardiopsis sp. Huas11 TaxID=2183912 RepID=UPI000EAF0625|nr:LysE family transporter [Nocardiopsis sp. Huas11]RKS04791.1 arginine exporter protein ArgO [Nocardiopsis sp. Huas11]
MMQTLIAGLAAGYGLAVPVGAVAVLMVNMTARTSFRMGAAAAMGAVTADALYAVAAVLGGRALALAVEPIATPLTWAAALVLVVMAVRVVRGASARGVEAPDRGPTPVTAWRAYLVFLGLTALNPWPAIYFVALILGRQAGAAMGAAETAVYVGAILLASASWQLFLAAGGTVLGRALTGPRGRRWTAGVSGLLIGGLAVGMVAA